MSRHLPLDERIAYLETAVAAARLSFLRIDQWSWAQRPEREKWAAHIDNMLDQLSGCYWARSMGLEAAPDEECEGV